MKTVGEGGGKRRGCCCCCCIPERRASKENAGVILLAARARAYTPQPSRPADPFLSRARGRGGIHWERFFFFPHCFAKPSICSSFPLLLSHMIAFAVTPFLFAATHRAQAAFRTHLSGPLSPRTAAPALCCPCLTAHTPPTLDPATTSASSSSSSSATTTMRALCFLHRARRASQARARARALRVS